MKVFAVLSVLAVASAVPAWGRVLVEVTDNDLQPSCPYTAIPNTLFDLPYILLNGMHECYKPGPAFLHKLDTAPDTEAYRRIFQGACGDVPNVRTCIANVSKDTDLCLSVEQNKMFQTMQDFIELGIEKVCGDDSELIAKMYGEELKPLDFLGQIRVASCLTGTVVKTRYKLEKNIPEYTMRRYRAISDCRQCIRIVFNRYGRTAPNFESLMESMLSGMKCVSPGAGGEVVLCRTLEEGSSTELANN